MLIAAALLELAIAGTGTIKDKRRVSQALKRRLREKFNVAVSEIGDPDDHALLSLGCVSVGTDAVHLRERLQKAVRFAESLGLAELVADDIAVVTLDECEPDTDPRAGDTDGLPPAWRQR